MPRGTIHNYIVTEEGRGYLAKLTKLVDEKYFREIDPSHKDAYKIYDWAVLRGIEEGFYDRPEYADYGHVPAEEDHRFRPVFQRLFERGYIQRTDI